MSITRLARTGLVVPLLLLLAQVGLAESAYAGTHYFYVAPDGTGSDCTTAAPCDFQTALSGLVGDDVIVMAPGTYPKTGAYSSAIILPTNVTITGTSGQSPPVINSSNDYPVSLYADDRLTDVQINAFGSRMVIYAANGATVDHVTAAGGSDIAEGACVLNGATLTDSLCIATGGAAVYAQPAAAGNTVRNVTAVAASQYGIGLQADENGSGSTQITATNSIFLGTEYDVESSAAGSGSAEATLVHCDFANTHVGAGGSIDNDPGAGNITAAPKFVDERNADFDEAPGSPSIDAGTNSGIAASDTDLAGRARIQGNAVDIGAYEWRPTSKPAVHYLKVVAKSHHSLRLKVTINPGRLATTATFTAVRHGHTHSVLEHVTGSGGRPVTATVRHLKRHKRYVVRVTARNSRGHVHTGSVAVRTT